MTLYEKQQKYWAVFLIIAAACLAYARAVPAPYMWDDITLVEKNATLDDNANIPRYFLEDLGHFNRYAREMGFYRPMQALTFHTEVALFGRSAPAQRTVNILLHALAAVALMLLARTLLRSDRWALFAGLLFAVHPLCTEQVALIADRGGVLAGALSLWTLALIARAFPENGPVRAHGLYAACAFYVLALLSKDEALTMAAPALAWVYLAHPARRRSAKDYALAAAPIAALALIYVGWRWGILDITHAQRALEVEGGLATRAAAIPRLTLQALRLALLPVGLRPYRSFDYAAWTTPAAVISSAAVWIAVFAAAFLARKKAPAIAFGVFFFAASMAPSSGLVALIRPVAEHYYYLPTAGVCLALAGAAEAASRYRAAVLAALVVLAIFFAGTIYRCGYWRSETLLWADNAQKEPRDSRVMNNLGIASVESGDREKAVEYFRLSVKADPGNYKARVNHANLALELGRPEGVLEDISAVLAAESRNKKALVQLGRLCALFPSAEAKDLYTKYSADPECAQYLKIGLESAGKI
jgi:protein O-mannosyl-transferase